MFSSWTLRILAATVAISLSLAGRPPQSCWDGQFKTLVTFGDSYTDENRLGYFINHNGSAPPVGTDLGIGYKTATGGLSWPRYASFYSKTSLYNYAVSGAVCSNQVSPRFFSAINAPFPDIEGYEVPAYIADSQYTSPNGTKFFTGTPDDTVYAIWIGTNDLGNDAFLTDSQLPGKTVKDYMDCVFNQVARLYQNGGRYFVIMNLAPLELLPQYASPEMGGLEATQYFPGKAGKNGTEINGRMTETVAALNEVYQYRTPYEVVVNQTWANIKIAQFDVNSLMKEIYYNPASYLNGTAPLNVEGTANVCNLQGANCTESSSPDSFEWFDPLHPSEQTSRVIAREFAGVLNNTSPYATYWG